MLIEVDSTKRQALYDRLQERFVEKGTLVNVRVPYLVAMKDSVEDYRRPIAMLPQYRYIPFKGAE